jgi:hypothetical protein
VQEADKPRDPSGNEKEIYSSMVIEVVAFALLAESLRHSGRFNLHFSVYSNLRSKSPRYNMRDKPCAQRERRYGVHGYHDKANSAGGLSIFRCHRIIEPLHGSPPLAATI